MTETPQDRPEDNDFLAAEYALGLTPDDTLADVRHRLAHDAGFAAQVAGWQERLVAMTDDIAPVAPGKRAKKELLSRLFPKTRVPLMQRLWVWKGLTLAALVLLAYVSFPMLRPIEPPRATGPIFAAEMVGETEEWQVFAVLDPSRQGIALRRVSGEIPQGRVLELWAILPDAAPVSLGVVPEDGIHLPLPIEFANQIERLTLAITDEPPGGAPEGVPTGSIRAAGTVTAI